MTHITKVEQFQNILKFIPDLSLELVRFFQILSINLNTFARIIIDDCLIDNFINCSFKFGL